MADTNVVFLRDRAYSSAFERRDDGGLQLELFGCDYRQFKGVTFLDIDCLDQQVFVSALTRNAVCAVIDLRLRPIFEKPKFNHKFITTYLHSRSICYLEFNFLLQCDPSGWTADHAGLKFDARKGVTACVINQEVIDSGRLHDFKRALSTADEPWVEIHPKAWF